jgi:aspartyl-tRNA(Asn)/glutamyl-tRNA(Gln) amidotransferase subunit A
MEIQSLTLKQAAQDLKEKKYSSKELTQEIYTNIEKNDGNIKAYVNLTREKALAAAEKYDSSSETPSSAIAGVPGSIKDLFNWYDTPTTASSNMLKDYISPYNATVTQRLLDHDAVLVGKTNLDSFAHGSSTETSDFFTTRNPWDTNRLPGGSSGGSAASVAAGMAIYSVGTETAGSIRQPSSWCGLSGLKPTYGRVSRYGVISMGSSLDSPGPMCKSVEDCALLLEVLAGRDPKDATSHHAKVENYFENLNAHTVNGLKIGLPKKYFEADVIQDDVIIRVREALEVLESKGAELIDIELLDPKYSIAVYTLVCRSEVSSNLARFDGIRYGHTTEKNIETIDELISRNRGEGFGDEPRRRVMTGTYALSSGYYDAYYKKAQKVRTLIKKDLEKAFKQVDVIIGPTTPSTALEVGATKGNPLFGEVADMLVEAGTLAGYPGLTLPVGFDRDSLPVGMNIIAPQFEEQLILNTGYAYQQETDWHTKSPKL